jgi:uncharacterized protein YndB with AHSA1/START domain
LSEVVREIYIEAAPEVVYSYFTDTEKLTQWMGIKATLEPKQGGRFEVTINQERKIIGEYLELVPYSQIVVSWGWEGREDVPPGSSKVEITLTPYIGGTLVRLRHYNLPETAIPLHAKSWEHNLPRLKKALEDWLLNRVNPKNKEDV